MMPLRNTCCPRTGSKHTDHASLMLLANLLPYLFVRVKMVACQDGFEQPELPLIAELPGYPLIRQKQKSPYRKLNHRLRKDQYHTI